MRTHKIYSINFPTSHITVLATVIVVYIISLVLIYLMTGNLSFLTTFLHSSFLSTPPLGITSLISFSGMLCFQFSFDPLFVQESVV